MLFFNKFRCVYFSLIFIRLLISTNSFAFIHPDEYFQNSEIGSSLIFNFYNEQPFKSWEWSSNSPCRSITPVATTTGIAFFILKQFLGDSPSAYALFISQRLWMLGMSLLIDLSLWSTSRSCTTLLFYASSPVAFTFLLRPFSNSIETLLLAFAVLSYSKIIRPNLELSKLYSSLLGSLVAIGTFTRVTFLAFVLPLLLGVVNLASKIAASKRFTNFDRLSELVRQGTLIASSFLVSVISLVVIDSYYFSGRNLLSVFTPLNSLLFNVSTTNLAEHGIHPRYLHAIVNLPMLFGVGFFVIVWNGKDLWLSKGLKEKESNNPLYIALIAVSTLILSIFPHQEPRFLLPLIVPIALLIPQCSFFKSNTKQSQSYRRMFWIFWILHSIIFTILFGFLHQGGLIPVIMRLNKELRVLNLPFLSSIKSEPISAIEFVFWKTFMPPRHLLVPTASSVETSQAPSIYITDLAGASTSRLFSTFHNISTSTSSDTIMILVSPAYIIDTITFPQNTSSTCKIELYSKGIHVDMDKLDVLFKSNWDRLGIVVLLISRDCDWNSR